jgi:hypothetical protein
MQQGHSGKYSPYDYESGICISTNTNMKVASINSTNAIIKVTREFGVVGYLLWYVGGG